MRKDILESKSKIEVWVKENRPKAWMAEQLDCKIDTLNSYLNKWNIQYKGNMGARGYKPSPYKKNATQYLKSGSFIVTSKLRTKLIEEGLKQNKCEICGISEVKAKSNLSKLTVTNFAKPFYKGSDAEGVLTKYREMVLSWID